jgi:hypothetical protein
MVVQQSRSASKDANPGAEPAVDADVVADDTHVNRNNDDQDHEGDQIPGSRKPSKTQGSPECASRKSSKISCPISEILTGSVYSASKNSSKLTGSIYASSKNTRTQEDAVEENEGENPISDMKDVQEEGSSGDVSGTATVTNNSSTESRPAGVQLVGDLCELVGESPEESDGNQPVCSSNGVAVSDWSDDSEAYSDFSDNEDRLEGTGAAGGVSPTAVVKDRARVGSKSGSSDGNDNDIVTINTRTTHSSYTTTVSRIRSKAVSSKTATISKESLEEVAPGKDSIERNSQAHSSTASSPESACSSEESDDEKNTNCSSPTSSDSDSDLTHLSELSEFDSDEPEENAAFRKKILDKLIAFDAARQTGDWSLLKKQKEREEKEKRRKKREERRKVIMEKKMVEENAERIKKEKNVETAKIKALVMAVR